MKSCIIVASGPSAKGFIPPNNIDVIAVNGAIDWLSRADFWFTLDPSKANKQRMWELHYTDVKTYGAFDEKRHWFSVPPDITILERVHEDRLFRESYEEFTEAHYWFRRWGSIAKMSNDPAKIHTGNSSWGALQLARLLGYKRIMLVGVDGTQQARVEGGKPNNLSHLPLLFNGTADDIDVVNCGRMDCKLPKMSIKEGIEWITAHE